MVRAGESSGTLEIVLDRLADITEKQQSLNNKIKSIMAYPTIMAVLGTAVLFFLLAVIVPRLTAIFTDVNQALPLTTRILIDISDFLQSSWWILLILVAIGVLSFRYVAKTEKGRYTIDKIILALPLIGPLAKKLAVARFARTLGSLLENGVSMLSALDIVKNIVGNVIIAGSVESSAKEVEKGYGLGKALEADKVFPYLSVQMIQVGEQSGELETMLSKIADVFENEVESTMVSLTSLLEPLIILIMGIVVGFVVLSIVQPIMEMNQLVR
jgi:general secretion pathway protein F